MLNVPAGNMSAVHGDDEHFLRLIAQLYDNRTIVADKVVLALGHFPSRPPQVESNVVLNSKRYLRNPWDAAGIARIPSNEPVLLLGTGLTMVDVAATLLTVTPKRPIAAISRRGLVPHPIETAIVCQTGALEHVPSGD